MDIAWKRLVFGYSLLLKSVGLQMLYFQLLLVETRGVHGDPSKVCRNVLA